MSSRFVGASVLTRLVRSAMYRVVLIRSLMHCVVLNPEWASSFTFMIVNELAHSTSFDAGLFAAALKGND